MQGVVVGEIELVENVGIGLDVGVIDVGLGVFDGMFEIQVDEQIDVVDVEYL